MTPADHPDDAGHVEDELPALLAGDLEPAAIRQVTLHLRRCPSCRDALVEVAAGAGALSYAARTLTVAPPLVAPPAVATVVPIAPSLPTAPTASSGRPTAPAPRRRSSSPRLLAVAAVVLALALGGLVGSAWAGRGTTTTPSAESVATTSARLRPVGAAAATGEVRMGQAGATSTMTVRASLPPAPAGSYYEVWLLQPATGHMVAVGVLPSGQPAAYRLPTGLLHAYQAVDISLQTDDGRTVHSDTSLLRATYA